MKQTRNRPGIKLSVSAADRKQQRVVRASCGNVFHQDKIDTDSDRSRQRFINRFAAKLQKNQAELTFLHDVLVRKAEKADAKVEAAATKAALEKANQSLANAPDSRDLSEIDPGRIVRPERFIVPEANGLTVPILTSADGIPVGKWAHYILHADGRRECCPLSARINLGDAGSLCVYPRPAEPRIVGANAGWSRKGRDDWFAGAADPSPVNLFDALVRRLKRFLDFSVTDAEGHIFTLALWTIFTYIYHAWPALPYLSIGGPIGSGKTQVFEVLGRLVFRPFTSSSMTAAALFRTLHERGGTLLFDEGDRLKQLRDPATIDLLGMLLVGYKRGGQATRMEKVGDSWRPESFQVYGPKAIACVSGLPPSLISRCIQIPMFRASATSPKPRQRLDADPIRWQNLRDQLHAVALNHGSMWLELAERTAVCPEMSGRDFEIWQPLLALAAWLDDSGQSGLYGTMIKHAGRCIAETRNEAVSEADERLLRCLATMLTAGSEPRASDICQAVKREPGFETWSDRGVAARLKAYGLATSSSNGKKIYRKQLLQLLGQTQENYGVDLGLKPKAAVPRAQKRTTERPDEGYVGYVRVRSQGSGGGRADSNGRPRPVPK